MGGGVPVRGISSWTSYCGKNEEVDMAAVPLAPFVDGVGDLTNDDDSGGDSGEGDFAPFGISPTLSMTNACGGLGLDADLRVGSCAPDAIVSSNEVEISTNRRILLELV